MQIANNKSRAPGTGLRPSGSAAELCAFSFPAPATSRHNSTGRNRKSPVFMRIVAALRLLRGPQHSPVLRMMGCLLRHFLNAASAPLPAGSPLCAGFAHNGVEAATTLQDATVFAITMRVVACSGCSPFFGFGRKLISSRRLFKPMASNALWLSWWKSGHLCPCHSCPTAENSFRVR